MRDIKFRGKHIHAFMDPHNTGIWVYGYLCNDHYINSEELMGEMLVDKDTVGQYTGLKDKNGVEIYEGDIILTQPYRDKPFSSKAKEKRLKGIVFYNIKCGKNFVHDSDKLKYWGAEWNIEIIDKEAYKKYSYCSWGSFFECEVIGNIYDNPELLGE